MNGPPAIAYVHCTDGTVRPVIEDFTGQYVIDEDGCKVRGVWFIPPEECVLPIIVDAGPPEKA